MSAGERKLAETLDQAASGSELHPAAIPKPSYEEDGVAGLSSWLVNAAGAVTGGEVTALCLFDEDGKPSWTVAGRYPADFEQLGDPNNHPVLAAAARGEAIATVDDLVLEPPPEPEFQATLLPLRSVIAVPSVGNDGHVFGLVLAGHREPDRFGDEMKAGVVALAHHFAFALETRVTLATVAKMEQTQKRLVNQLQAALRPPTPTVRDTELGVYYLPADPSAPTGGDLYDWMILPDGDLHLAIVDVEGKGLTATKDAMALTNLFRMLVLDGCPLDDVVQRADALIMAQSPSLTATALVGRYTPSTGHVQLVGAGHPPAFFVTEKGVREVAPLGLPIGSPGAKSFGPAEVTLGRSDVLILYTDGLIEATKDILEGLLNLRKAAIGATKYPAPHLARILVDECLRGAGRNDDSLAVILKRRIPPLPTGHFALGPFEYRFTPNPAAVQLARHFLMDWLVRVPIPRDEAEDLGLVASELCTNAIRYASGRPEGVALRAWSEGADVILEVEDDGDGTMAWQPREDGETPDPEAEAGRGLYLVEALCDQVTVRRGEGTTTVRCVKTAVIPVE
ncbi:MAG: SpoIIE family protein phosphatase [Actinomycetota bacterium]|nr:SpoIIE family protein phosphatase [Actinomycetota bacterium]